MRFRLNNQISILHATRYMIPIMILVTSHRLFSHDGKVRILNRDSRCASWITIRNTVFWTVCTPNHVEIRDLRCVTRKHLWTVIWDAHSWFGVHTVQNTVFRIVIRDAHLESRFKIRTLPSCENSQRVANDISPCLHAPPPPPPTQKKNELLKPGYYPIKHTKNSNHL